MLGASIPFMFVPLMPEILEILAEREGIKEDTQLNDMTAGCYNVAYGSGSAVAPIIGASLKQTYQDMLMEYVPGPIGPDGQPTRIPKPGMTDVVGWAPTCDTMAIGAACYAFIYMAINIRKKHMPCFPEGRNPR